MSGSDRRGNDHERGYDKFKNGCERGYRYLKDGCEQGYEHIRNTLGTNTLGTALYEAVYNSGTTKNRSKTIVNEATNGSETTVNEAANYLKVTTSKVKKHKSESNFLIRIITR